MGAGGSSINRKSFNGDLMGAVIATTFENKHLSKCNQNTAYWISLAKLFVAANRTIEAKEACVFPAKNPDRDHIVKYGMPFFTEDSKDDDTIREVRNDVFREMSESVIETVNAQPFSDERHYFKGQDDMHDTMIEVFGTNTFPLQSVYWHYWNNTHTLSKLAFFGIGQYFLTAVPAGGIPGIPLEAKFRIDLSSLAAYPVREKFEAYGAVAYFAEDQTTLGIFWTSNQRWVPIKDTYYSHARAIFCASLFLAATMRHHIINCHWVVSNSLLVCSERFLSDTHPLRRFLKPHTFNASHVNLTTVRAMAPHNGIAGRLFGFTEVGWSEFISEQLAEFKYRTLDEHFDSTGLSSEMATMPLYEDGNQYWRIIHHYVHKFIDIIYDNDRKLHDDEELRNYWKALTAYHPSFEAIGDLSRVNLINQLTFSIFWITGGHSLFGAMEEYLQSDDGFCGKIFKLNHDKPYTFGKCDIQTFFQQIAFMSLAFMKMPHVMDDWSHVFDYELLRNHERRHKAILENLENLQAQLQKLSKDIDDRNSMRLQPFDAFNPKYMHSSMSV